MDAVYDLAVTDDLLRTTRSVRKRLDLDREVELEVLLECLDLAQQAPTGGNRQDWRFLVIRNAEKRAAIADVYRRVSATYFAAGGSAAAEGQRARVRTSSEFLRQNLQHVPVHVIPLVRRELSGTLAGEASIFGSIIPASWSFMLALRSRGLGSVYTTLHLVDDGAAEVATLLDIPDEWTQTALLPVAYTVGTNFKPAHRPPVREIVGIDGF